MLKIIKFAITWIVFLSVCISIKSDLLFVDTLDNKKVLIQDGFYVFDNAIYYVEKYVGQKQSLYCYKNGQITEPYAEQLEAKNPEQKFPFFYMADTNSMVFTFGETDYGNGVVVKQNNNWTKYDHTNSELNDGAPVYDALFSKSGEIAIINSSSKISFVKDIQFSFKNCGDDLECMPQPFLPGVGIYFEGCLFYMNIRRNFVRLCNKEIDKIFNWEEFQVSSRYQSFGTSYSIHNDKLYFCNIITNQLYSIKGDEIQIYTPLSSEQISELGFDASRPLKIKDYIFGNDGYLYCLFKETINGSETAMPGGWARLIKMAENFDIVEIIPIPNSMDDTHNAVFKLVKDITDTNNKKLYITASRGFYIYDPEPTTVKNSTESGPASLFVTEVYPNPSGGLVNVRYGSDVSNSGKIKMFITNVMGQRIKEFDHRGSYNNSTGYGTAILDVSDIATGSYQLVITDGNKYVSKNILVIR